jgi:leucyl-tRNA synthetase
MVHGAAVNYDPQRVEAKWQARWEKTQLYRTRSRSGAPTFYCLDFFPYPSGAGLSVGHGRNYVPTDVVARYQRMMGKDVLHPMGWDAFGLPAENEAIKRSIHPRKTTERYAANYRRQMTLMGCSYDWEREINSSHPRFYRWTQWFFLLLYQRGLAYRAVGQQWWCPVCKTVLANEQVESDGSCWRCHHQVGKRDLEQWYLGITAYADQLLDDLEGLDWPDHIVVMQRNWIGRSEGVEFQMRVAGSKERFDVFTTRLETMGGMTFVALAPEHPLVERIVRPAYRERVLAYREAAVRRTEVDRQQSSQQGVFTGAHAINPLNEERIPILLADYVLMDYGTGAVMGVPGHDQRDFEFATHNDIPVRVVVAPPGWEGEVLTEAHTGEGTMVQSERWSGMSSAIAREQMSDWLEAKGLGQRKVAYRMRDWLISRQRYWGAPIPVVFCSECGIVPVPVHDLPVLLPGLEAWQPGEEGRSPLATVAAFVDTICPQCGGPARRETDTLDGFACSSWYFLRFVSPDYDDGPFDPEALARWGTPDLYVGGAEHAVMHLLYARFWTKVMADAGLVSFREPFPVLRSQGVMHARDPVTKEIRRMSKSAGNVVTPDEVVHAYGADVLRLYLLFMAPFENNTVWDKEGIAGPRRFLERAWRLVKEIEAGHPQSGSGVDEELRRALHRSIWRVTKDIQALKFNTAVAALMELLNTIGIHHQQGGVTQGIENAVRTFVLLLAPFAPYMAEEMWERLGGDYSVHQQAWPTWDERAIVPDTVTLAIQLDGKVRDRIEVPVDVGEAQARQRALACDGLARHLGDRQVRRIIYVPGRLVNVVTG